VVLRSLAELVHAVGSADSGVSRTLAGGVVESHWELLLALNSPAGSGCFSDTILRGLMTDSAHDMKHSASRLLQ
jgi:hypothetical protein